VLSAGSSLILVYDEFCFFHLIYLQFDEFVATALFQMILWLLFVLISDAQQ